VATNPLFRISYIFRLAFQVSHVTIGWLDTHTAFLRYIHLDDCIWTLNASIPRRRSSTTHRAHHSLV
jgi:hypothetical protein